MASTGSRLTQQAVSAEKERYPVLGNTTLRQVPDNDQIPISRFSASHKIPRKEISSPNLQKRTVNTELTRNMYDPDDPFRDGVYNINLAPTVNGLPDSPSGLSAAAAAVEKSSREESSVITEPRQTRTSSLRARLSSGQLVKDGHNKVVGFTDFTAPNEPTSNAVRRDSLRARKEAQARRSITPPIALTVPTKSSMESHGGNRAPAKLVANRWRPAHPRRPSSRGGFYNEPQATAPPTPPIAPIVQKNPSTGLDGGNRAPAKFIAGSRRPTHPCRPSSRGSLHNETQATVLPPPPVPPSRPAPMLPVSRGGEVIPAKKDDKDQDGSTTYIPSRRSSIPIPRQDADNTVLNGAKAAAPIQKNLDYPKEARVETGIYEDQVSKDLVKELKTSTLPPNFAEILRSSYNDDNADGLEPIEESPQHAYQLKRLSLNTSGFGPTLRISPHAESFIMGPKPDDEKQPLNKKKSKELEREMIRNDLKERKETSKPISVKKATERPSSSQGLPRSAPRVGLVDPKARGKKARSADLSIPSRKGEIQQTLSRLSAGTEPKGNPQDKPSKPSSTASFNDPFFDAPEEPQSAAKDAKTPLQAESKQAHIDEAAWISPLKKKSVDTVDEEVLVLDERLPSSLQLQFEDDLKMEAQCFIEGDPFRSVNARGVHADAEINESTESDVKTQPRTPDRSIIRNRNVSGNSAHPPRSSSRTPHPDFTGEKAHKSSPLITESMRKGPPTPPKDFESVKNSLGSKSGHASTQLDIKKLVSNRASGGGDSYKSQGSVSKSMLSSMRGLFHKRSAENEPFKGRKSRSKPAIQTNGSPFPHISEVHPIHRPTLSSMARSNAATPRLNSITTAATPSYASPIPSEVSTTTTLAMQIIESARNERSSPKKERLLELSRIMVDAITQARDAEKAMEEAKQAARKAEVSYVMCKKTLGEVERCVKGWRNDVDC